MGNREEEDAATALQEIQPLIAPLLALSEFMKELGDACNDGPALRKLAGKLTEAEITAIERFAKAGKKCLGLLSGETVAALEDLQETDQEITDSITKLRTQQFVMLDGMDAKKTRSIAKMFEKFDTDHDGALSIHEWREAFRALTGGALSGTQVEQLVKAADVNKDGLVDIAEFTVWLYQNQGVDVKKKRVVGDSDIDAIKYQLQKAEAELKVKTEALTRMDEEHEEEMKATHDFWQAVAKHSLPMIEKNIDLKNAEWLGNGKYGFVCKAKRHEDKREVVVKMMGIRWSHLAVQEWQHGAMCGKHPNIVEYEDVMLHNDDDDCIENLLKAGYADGKLKSKTKRSKFPDRFLCLTLELMNQGTVQDWMNNDLLVPGGTFVVMQKVASALAYLHTNTVAHNDIKPENIFLHREGGGDMIVKLGDLGLTDNTPDHSNDFWQYGMTVFCMLTGEQFGARKYRLAEADNFVDECQQACQQAAGEGRLGETLKEVPLVLRNVFHQEITMEKVRDWPSLQNWGFFDEGSMPSTESPNKRANELAIPTKDTHIKRVLSCMND